MQKSRLGGAQDGLQGGGRGEEEKGRAGGQDKKGKDNAKKIQLVYKKYEN